MQKTSFMPIQNHRYKNEDVYFDIHVLYGEREEKRLWLNGNNQNFIWS